MAAESRFEARTTADPAEALETARAFLASDPVGHNVILGLLHERTAFPTAGRYWTIVDGSRPVAFAMQSPLGYVGAVAAASADAALALGEDLAAAEPMLPAVSGEVGTVSRVAGAFASARRVPARPFDGQRLYRLGRLVPPSGVEGRLRRAGADDADLVVNWMREFHLEITGSAVLDEESVRRRLESGLFWLWEDAEPVSMAAVPATVAGVSRIGAVYTPPARRRRGYAAAVVAGLSARCLADGSTDCILYTELSNPTSNAVYQRIGYRPVLEVVRYSFGDS